jgi:hypothetical protein
MTSMLIDPILYLDDISHAYGTENHDQNHKHTERQAGLRQSRSESRA